MNAESLRRQFDVVADSPDGVSKLRELILQLAVRGRLVPQACSDARIASSDLPAGWTWTRLEAVGVIGPRNSAPDDLDVGFCPMAMLPEVHGRALSFEERSWRTVKKGYTHLADGDVVVAKITPCFQNRKAAVIRGLPNGIGAGTTELHVLRPDSQKVLPAFVLVFLRSPAFVNGGVETMSGTAGQQRVTRDYFARTPFPMPPLAEQRLIVAKVDELMALCDALELRQQRRAEVRRRLNRSVLYHLTTSADDETRLAAHWRRLRENFGLLYDVPETVTDLRRAVLGLAVRGKLLLQDPEDEAACVLLERIVLEKRRMREQGVIGKSKELPAITDAELPFAAPHGWEWVPLGSLTSKIGSGSTPLGGKHSYVDDGVPFLRSQNVWNDGLRLEDVALIPPRTHEKMAGTAVRRGDLLLNITGASIGRSAVVPDDLDAANVSQHVAIVRPVERLTRQYLHLALIAPYFQEAIMRTQVGISREGLSVGRLAELPVPLPPLAEQDRIVAKVTAFMAICDRLEAQLVTARDLGASLAASVVQVVTAA